MKGFSLLHVWIGSSPFLIKALDSVILGTNSHPACYPARDPVGDPPAGSDRAIGAPRLVRVTGAGCNSAGFLSRSLLSVAIGMAVGLIAPEPVWAQISPDRSLPRPSQVRRSGNRTEVTAGTQRGRNLFHSLRRFSIDSGETAAFQDIDASVDRVFVRVTGREASRINGRDRKSVV